MKKKNRVQYGIISSMRRTGCVPPPAVNGDLAMCGSRGRCCDTAKNCDIYQILSGSKPVFCITLEPVSLTLRRSVLGSRVSDTKTGSR